MIKKIAQEFLWLIFSVLAAIPLSFLFLSCIEMVESSNEIVIIEFFIAGIIINVWEFILYELL